MQDHEFNLMLGKYSQDAEGDLANRERQTSKRKHRQAVVERFQTFLKRLFLVLALLGVGAGFFFAHDLGWLTATITAPVIAEAPTKNIAKVKRKLAEASKNRDSELDEIMQ